jgi:DNA invertase Pin-like site-specific DNA recombinase
VVPPHTFPVPGTFLADPSEVVASGYVRQSSAKTNKTEASPLTQRAAIETGAGERAARFVRHYEDIGISGWNPDAERPGFEAMLTGARSGAFNMLIVYDVSRFSRREVMDAIPIVTELHRLGVTIVSLMDGTFAPRDTMALIYLIMRLDAVNKESAHKSQKVKAVKAAQKAEGSWLGGQTPYGFTTESYIVGKLDLMRLVHHKDEAANLRAVWATIKAHKDAATARANAKNPGSLSFICGFMNATDVPTKGQNVGKERTGSQWTVRTLKGILRNPIIAGIRADPIYKLKADGSKGRTLAGYRIQRDEDGRPLMAAEPIIPVAEWYELQKWLDGRGQGVGVARNATLLSGLRTAENTAVLTCVCGRPMTGLTSGPKPVYRCSRGSGVPSVAGEHTGLNAVMQNHLDDHVARRIFALIQDATADDPQPGTLAIVTEAAKVFAAALEAPETAGERTALVAERADAQRALDDLYDDLEAGLYEGRTGRERFKAAKGRIDGRITAAGARLAELTEPGTVDLPLDEWLHPGEGGDPIGEGSWWHGTSLEDRRAFVALFVQRLTIKPPESAHRGRVKGGYDVTPRVELDWVHPDANDEDE